MKLLALILLFASTAHAAVWEHAAPVRTGTIWMYGCQYSPTPSPSLTPTSTFTLTPTRTYTPTLTPTATIQPTPTAPAFCSDVSNFKLYTEQPAKIQWSQAEPPTVDYWWLIVNNTPEPQWPRGQATPVPPTLTPTP